MIPSVDSTSRQPLKPPDERNRISRSIRCTRYSSAQTKSCCKAAHRCTPHRAPTPSAASSAISNSTVEAPSSVSTERGRSTNAAVAAAASHAPYHKIPISIMNRRADQWRIGSAKAARRNRRAAVR